MAVGAPSAGSNLHLQRLFWPVIREGRFSSFGATTTILPLIPPDAAINATTHTTWPAASGSSQTATWSTAPSGLTTAYKEDIITTRSSWLTPGMYGPAGLPGIKFAGSNANRLTVPDAAYWTRSTSAFSIVACVVQPAAGTERVIIAKWDATALAQREWILDVDTAGKIQFLLRDQSASVVVSRVGDAASPTLVPIHIAVTHDGGTGATAMANAVIYINGASISSTATNNASYAGMDDGTASVSVGRDSDSNSLSWAGLIFGGPFGPTFVQAQLTANQVLRDYELWREAMGLGR